MNPAVWLLMGWVVVTPVKTDFVTVNSRGLNIYQHDTRADCFERPAVLEDLVSMDDDSGIRDVVGQNLKRRTLPARLPREIGRVDCRALPGASARPFAACPRLRSSRGPGVQRRRQVPRLLRQVRSRRLP